MQMNDSTSAHVATDALEITHSPELWRLLLGLVLWGICCANAYLSPLVLAAGLAGTWWCLRYPTWRGTLAALREPVRWRTSLFELAAIACLLGFSEWVAGFEDELPLLSPNGGWSMLALWLLGVLLATGRFLIARDRSRQAPRT